MKKRIIYLFLLLIGTTAISQDLHFSQFNEMPLLRNPALAGNFNGQCRLLTIYRNQWQMVSVPYRTLAAGTEFKLYGGQCIDDDFTLTGGVQYVRDEAGDSKLTRNFYLLSLTGKKQLTERMYAAAGFCGGPVSSNFNFAALKWGDQYVNGQYSPLNPTQQPVPNTGRNYWDIGWGVSLGVNDYDFQWYAGYGRYHDNKPKVGFGNNDLDISILPVRQSLNAGFGLRRNETELMNLYADFMWQGNQAQFLAGVQYKWEWNNISGADADGTSLGVGVYYRLNDAVIPTLTYQLRQFSMGLSYDVNVSRLHTASQFQGGFEFSLKFRGVIFGYPEDCGKTGCFN